MNYTVMIIDDDPITLFLQKVIIEKSDFSLTPIAFLNGYETLEYLRLHYDKNMSYIIFLDINMPGMNGWQFIEGLDKYNYEKNITIVIVSSSIDMADYAKANTYKRVIAYLEKPIDIDMINRVKKNPLVRHIPGDKEDSSRQS